MYSYNSVPVYQTSTEDRETRPRLLKIIDFHTEMTSLTPDPLPSPPDRGVGEGGLVTQPAPGEAQGP